MVAGAAWVQGSGQLGGLTPGLTQAGGGVAAGARGGQAPSPGHEAQDTPLGQPAPLLSTSSAWRPTRTQPGTADPANDGTNDASAAPVAWDPCRPIHYVTRPDGAPAGAQQLLQQAFARVSLATGLRFIDDGVTTEGPSPQRAPYQPERYGDRWAPVLITYVSPAEVPDIAASVIAQAGPTAISASQRSSMDRFLDRPGQPVDVYVSGAVDIDAAQVTDALTRPGGDQLVRAVFEHELGHLLGLAHVEDPTQLMYPQTSQVLDYAPGDLTGLAALGTGPCVPEV